jgi:hypothetical protein
MLDSIVVKGKNPALGASDKHFQVDNLLTSTDLSDAIIMAEQVAFGALLA